MTDSETDKRVFLTKDDRAELFEIQVRGAMATAFNQSSQVPTQEDWDLIRGLTEPTMRHIAEIGSRTGFNMHMQLHERKP